MLNLPVHVCTWDYIKFSWVRTALHVGPPLYRKHGETFVLDDGGETDLDLGNYERFLDVTLTNRHNITTGKVYQDVIHRERRGDYLGKTVQIVPHATDAVQQWIKTVAKVSVDGTGAEPEVCLIEVGGTIGDIESMVFLEALRQHQFSTKREDIMFVHVSLIPVIGSGKALSPWAMCNWSPMAARVH
jgi:CTP synthase